MSYVCVCLIFFFFFKQKTAYEMRISDWSSDVCSSDLAVGDRATLPKPGRAPVGFVEQRVVRRRAAGGGGDIGAESIRRPADHRQQLGADRVGRGLDRTRPGEIGPLEKGALGEAGEVEIGRAHV